ncbi:MAG: pyridoxal phosphate-dependent aminotransferase [Phycisphaerae bacterium]|nr:pyridoxal phosphate-dependent aminotransferase [Phycisphaerae bacterium]
MENVQSPIIPIVGELIRDHPGTISLGQGVVAYGPPPEAIAQIEHFLARPENNKYHLVTGIPQLLEKIRDKLRTENNIAVDGGTALCVTAGANMAFLNAILAICDPGDEVILLTPYYFNHEMAVQIADCRPVPVPTDDACHPVLSKIEQAVTDRTRAVVTISPNNPAGVVYSETALRQISDFCRRRGLYHISDEAYEYFTYDGRRHFSPASFAGGAAHTISLFSLSKAYGFASWRIGYMTFPSHLEPAVKKIQDTNLICPPVISQYAAAGALEAGAAYCRRQLTAIERVRRIVTDELNTLGDLCTISPAAGAFYYLLKIDTDMDAMHLTERLIREHGVAVIPGRTFGLEEGCYLRISFGPLQEQTAREGIRRLIDGLTNIVRK